MAKTKVLITVKTYPNISSKYDELVCTAGFLEDGSMIRIYPIPFRKLDYEQQYAKYQWVEMDLVKNTSDFRPESYTFTDRFFTEIKPLDKIGTDNNWQARKDIVLKNTAAFLCAFSVLLLICYRSSVINESFQALGALKEELEDTYVLNAQIEAEIQTQKDLSKIENYAKYQLGMQKPKESQIQRIYVKKEDKISTPIVIEEEENSFLENLVDDLLKLID